MSTSDTEGASCLCADREGDVVHLLFTRCQGTCQGTAEGEQSYRPSARAVEARCESGIQIARRRYAWPYFSIVHWHVLERRQTFQLTRFSVKLETLRRLYLILYGQFGDVLI